MKRPTRHRIIPDRIEAATFIVAGAMTQGELGYLLQTGIAELDAVAIARIASVSRLVTADYFKVMGAAPLLGRDFTEEDDRSGAALVTIISHPFWQQRFAGDPKVVGKSITLDDKSYTVIGVAPEAFTGLDACMFCLGISVRQTSGEAEYRTITHDFAMAAAGALQEVELDRWKEWLSWRIVHDAAPLLFKTRWTLSYLRGPLGRDELALLGFSMGGAVAVQVGHGRRGGNAWG